VAIWNASEFRKLLTEFYFSLLFFYKAKKNKLDNRRRIATAPEILQSTPRMQKLTRNLGQSPTLVHPAP